MKMHPLTAEGILASHKMLRTNGRGVWKNVDGNREKAYRLLWKDCIDGYHGELDRAAIAVAVRLVIDQIAEEVAARAA